MATIYELTEEGNELVNEAFVRGERDLTDEEIENARQDADFDLEPDDVDVEALRRKFEAEMGDEGVDFGDVTIDGSKYSRGDAKIDAALASEVRKHLGFTREQASHDGVWRYLAVVEFPDFVRCRWPYSDDSSERTFNSAREKFLRPASDLYGNALVRLWWMAELTRDGDNYSLTRVALEHQELANDVFDRGYARYPPAVRATVDELRDASSSVVSDTTTKLNHALSTIRLESLSESELREMVRDIRTKVEA
jgi:hypothetical protein